MILTKDNLRLGLVLGILGPVIGLLVIFFIKCPSCKFFDFMDEFIHNNSLITSIGTLCLLANVILFTIYVNTNRDKTAKGIFVVTLVYGISILMLKLSN